MHEIDLFGLLTKWVPLLKISEKYPKGGSNSCSNKFSCKLNALDHMQIKQEKENKTLERK